ncbi:phage tail tape measure C-terminal domain-containing protein [Paracoccaceae bacterium Fryx2]|nr:phage tail tape measure C-terminal domain-containing protein [Paracoccaceae bacterium Fryx2]
MRLMRHRRRPQALRRPWTLPQTRPTLQVGRSRAAAEVAKTGWAAVSQSLADYSKQAMDWGKGLGSTLVSGFQSAETAFKQFITTGKFDFKSLVSSILADLATLAFKRAVLGPIANALSGVVWGWRYIWLGFACRRHGRDWRNQPQGSSAGLCRSTAHACWRLGGSETR